MTITRRSAHKYFAQRGDENKNSLARAREEGRSDPKYRSNGRWAVLSLSRERRFFQWYENGTTEVRTKSTNIENLLSVEIPRSNVIPSRTLSPQFIAESIEHRTAGFKQRVEAARRYHQVCYTVSIRLDPGFRYPDW